MIRRAAALLLVVATIVLLRQRLPAADAAPATALALGFSLMAAAVLGGAAERLRLPRLSGYLVFGLLCGPYMLNLITAPMARELRLVNGLAIALIAFVAGLEINVGHLRPRLRSVVLVGLAAMLGGMLVLSVVLWAAWPWLPLGDPGGTVHRVAAAVVTAALVISFSPTVTIAVIAESRARGTLTELVLAIVIVADLLLILVFALAMQLARWAEGSAASDVSVLVVLAWDILGSLAFGAVVGSLFAIYLKVVARELTLALLAVCIVFAAVAPALHFEVILTALAAGLVVENIAPPPGDRMRVAVERGALPVLIVFFATAGASLQLDVLAAIGPTALALALLRVWLIRAFTNSGIRKTDLPPFPASLIWLGLISQAGVTLGLATLVAEEFPGWGTMVQTLVVGLTGLHVLVGPIAFRAALVRAGEVGRLDAELSSDQPPQDESPVARAT